MVPDRMGPRGQDSEDQSLICKVRAPCRPPTVNKKSETRGQIIGRKVGDGDARITSKDQQVQERWTSGRRGGWVGIFKTGPSGNHHQAKVELRAIICVLCRRRWRTRASPGPAPALQDERVEMTAIAQAPRSGLATRFATGRRESRRRTVCDSGGGGLITPMAFDRRLACRGSRYMRQIYRSRHSTVGM